LPSQTQQPDLIKTKQVLIKKVNQKMKTRKLMLAAVMGMIAIGTTVAQEVSFGVKAGGNYSTLSGDVEGMSYLPGFHAGGFAEIKLGEKFALQPELLFSLEGGKSSFKFESPEISMSSEEKVTLGYINLPVMAKYFVAEGLSIELDHRWVT